MKRRAATLGLLSAAGVLATGCATPPAASPDDRKDAFWSGRLALQVEDQATEAFAALFELRGGPAAGELRLLSPLGSTLAVVSWRPGHASLQTGGQAQAFDSVDAVVQRATGTSVPVAALFDWLAGVNTPVPGWQADLAQLGQGRLRARRTQPAPAADLRIALDR